MFSDLRGKYVKEKKGEFLGKSIEQCEAGSLIIQQKEYAQAITGITISKERRKEKNEQITDKERTQMRGVLGEMAWLVAGSRPDLSGSCSLMQQRATSAKVRDLIEINKMTSFAHDFSSKEIWLKPIPIEGLEIAVWSDASFANASEKKSQGGYLIAAVDHGLRKGQWTEFSPWRWRSSKQDI